MSNLKKVAIGLSIVVMAQGAFAAPFCVVTSYGRQCYYYDNPSCQRAAASSNGACVINQEEAKPAPASGAPFCVVTSYATQCWYYDASSCQQAAANSNGACAVNPNR